MSIRDVYASLAQAWCYSPEDEVCTMRVKRVNI